MINRGRRDDLVIRARGYPSGYAPRDRVVVVAIERLERARRRDRLVSIAPLTRVYTVTRLLPQRVVFLQSLPTPAS
jgi:hypothetical protein